MARHLPHFKIPPNLTLTLLQFAEKSFPTYYGLATTTYGVSNCRILSKSYPLLVYS